MPEDVLDRPGRAVLQTIGSCSWSADYYLAGGTGLALHLGHRRSYDLDLFSYEPAEVLRNPDQLTDELTRRFGAERAHVVLKQTDQLHWSIDGTKVSFIAYPFPLRYPTTLHLGVQLADERDIALMKAYVIGRRATARDYIDLYFLLRKGSLTIAELVAEAAEKFRLHGESLFSTRLFLSQLTYTDDVEGKDSATQLVLDEGLQFDTVETYLKEQVRNYVRHTLGGPSREDERG